MIGTTDSLGFEVDGHNALGVKRALDKVLERLVSLATLVIILHVLHASELGLGYKGISLRPSILIGGTNNHGEDIGLAVLEQIDDQICTSRDTIGGDSPFAERR